MEDQWIMLLIPQASRSPISSDYLGSKWTRRRVGSVKLYAVISRHDTEVRKRLLKSVKEENNIIFAGNG